MISGYCFQAQKRKLGLLEDDDVSKLTENEEENIGDDASIFAKSRGMFMLKLLSQSSVRIKNFAFVFFSN